MCRITPHSCGLTTLARSPFVRVAAAKQQENVACFVSDGQAKLKDERPRWDEDDHLLRDVVIGFQENEPDPTQQSADAKLENSKEITQQIAHVRCKESTAVFKVERHRFSGAAKTFSKVEANDMYIMDAEQMQHVQQYATRSIPLVTFADGFLRRRPGWRPGCARMRALPTRPWARVALARHCVSPCPPLIVCNGIARIRRREVRFC